MADSNMDETLKQLKFKTIKEGMKIVKENWCGSMKKIEMEDLNSGISIRHFRPIHFGFELKFVNGYSIDVINGYGSYSDNHYIHNLGDETVTRDCEIAVKYHGVLTNPFGWDDDVLGFVSADELANWIMKVKELKG